jgi:hypothetical protein
MRVASSGLAAMPRRSILPVLIARQCSRRCCRGIILHRYSITRVDYAGDGGGIIWKVELDPENDWARGAFGMIGARTRVRCAASGERQLRDQLHPV